MADAAFAIEIEAPAKVNLRLVVLERQASGYHGLETLFAAVSLSDTVRVMLAEPGIRLFLEGGGDLGPPERNLAVRAAQSFYAELGREPALSIQLQKRIPAAAGLGGGSSDAAAVLRALNALHGDPLPAAALLRLGALLGSDVAFFLCGSPLALAWGRGERLLTLPPLPPRPLLLAHPGEAMPTPEAFRRLTERRGGDYRPGAFAFPLAATAQWATLAPLAANDFEPGVFARIPRLRDAHRALAAAGAEISLLAGSGASIFGVFPGEAERDAAAAPLQALGCRTWAAHTLSGFPAPKPVPTSA